MSMAPVFEFLVAKESYNVSLLAALLFVVRVLVNNDKN